MTKDWIGKVLDKKGKKGKPRGEGTFTRQAETNGFGSVEEFARDIKANPNKYDTITKQRLNLYTTLRKM